MGGPALHACRFFRPTRYISSVAGVRNPSTEINRLKVHYFPEALYLPGCAWLSLVAPNRTNHAITPGIICEPSQRKACAACMDTPTHPPINPPAHSPTRPPTHQPTSLMGSGVFHVRTAVGRLPFTSWDSTTHTVGSVGGVDAALRKLTFSMQVSADRKQFRFESQSLRRGGGWGGGHQRLLGGALGGNW